MLGVTRGSDTASWRVRGAATAAAAPVLAAAQNLVVVVNGGFETGTLPASRSPTEPSV